MSFILRTDSYKPTHWPQYPPDAEIVFSNLQSRGGEYHETVFFGLQYILQQYLAGEVFNLHDINKTNTLLKEHFGQDLFNLNGWLRLYNKYKGKLPLKIMAVPEGSVIPVNNVLMTVENTDPEFPWLTNYVESLLLKVWYPTTVATISREVKKTIKYYLDRTGDPSLINFKLHDFGYRGVSSEESAAIGGAAHLVNFMGSDTLVALELIKDHYYMDKLAGFSIPASEHSTMTSWGQDNEREAYENMLLKYPKGLVACVSDSYDIFNACEHLWGEALKDRVINRDGVLVIRPDSGEPSYTVLRVLGILGEKFGYTTNEKGFNVLNPHVRVIQGDGVNPHSIREILDKMEWHKWSADNIAFGMGGALLQKCDRDTQNFAFKCSTIRRAGVWHDVYKTATGKVSSRGYLVLHKTQEGYKTISLDRNQHYLSTQPNVLQTVFEDGFVKNPQKFEDIRERAQV